MLSGVQEIGHEIAEHMAHADERLGLMDELSMALAFGLIGGLLAMRLRLPPIVGFLLAGIALSPYTPGHVADVHTAEQLGEIGVAFLMFGVGMHFSVKDLLEVKGIAVPGAIIQSILATALTIVLTTIFGWSLGAGIVMGLALSVASTVVLVRALMARDLMASQAGKVGVGWLVVEDLFSALVLVLLPVLAVSLGGTVAERSAHETLVESLLNKTDSVLAFSVRQAGVQESAPVLIGLTVINVAVLVGLLPLLRRAVSWLLAYIDRAKSDEMLTLAAVVVALFVSFGMNALFGVSVALGAFFAGIVVSASPLAHVVGEDVRPLRNLFGVLFFASVGMLLDPMTFVQMPVHLLAVVIVIVAAKPAIATGIALAFKQSRQTAMMIGAGLGQIGEFSFILGTLGKSLGLLPDEAYQLIIAGAIISIAVNPLVFRVMDRLSYVQPALAPVPSTASYRQQPHSGEPPLSRAG
ncbi:MAG: cation:proton antiporter [Chloroflexi bacterium]|nr:cation:proton antiporter [Chloroflexota bacterium]